jgi:electron transfer flavoprotein alpha subunit
MSVKENKGVWVFTEIKDHEKVLDGSLELLSKGREIADLLNEKLYSIVFSLDVEQYIPIIKRYGPDIIISNEETEDPQTLKHYNGEIFPDMWEKLMKKYKPSIILFPSTEAGIDLASRLAQRFSTGLTAHCSGLEIVDSKDYGNQLLLMKRPGFSGNLTSFILCPKSRPQMATVQQGIFKKKKTDKQNNPEIIKVKCNHVLSELKVVNIDSPKRWDKSSKLEKSRVIIAGGRGMGSKDKFQNLFKVARYLRGEVGSTRVPVLNGWCEEKRMIGQTGKAVHPEIYLGFGISGQIQHTSSIVSAKRIVSINSDTNALINEISDYIINEDINEFLPKLLERLQEERKEIVH